MKYFTKFNSLKFINQSSLSKFVVIALIFVLGIYTGYAFYTKQNPQLSQAEQKDKYISFILESYDKINQNYWEDLTEGQLINVYKQNIERLTGKTYKVTLGVKSIEAPKDPSQITQNNNLGSGLSLEGNSVNDLKNLNLGTEKEDKTNYKQAFEKMLTRALEDIEEGKKKEFAVTVASSVLASLQPAGRSGLFTQKQEENLKNTVQNINPDKDLYKDLGLEKGSSSEEVEQTYKKQEEELKKEDTPESKEKLKQLTYAKDVLTDTDKKKNYDTNKVEPTIASKNLSPSIAYLKFDKFSPTSYEEFLKSVNSYDKPDGPKALIFDLRGNIGGAIDALPFFLGNFLGDKQYVYDFMRKGESEPYKTIGNKLGGLSRMKQVVVLIDNQTQSSAELLAAALKRYHYGIIVGVPSKGWGTVEKVFQMDNQIDEGEKYSIFLVHSITLRDDNQPIEGRGVEPHINISNPDWENQLFEYFRYLELISAVKSVI